MSSVSYSQLLKNKNKDNDFQTFITKINNKFDPLTSTKSFCLRNIDMNKKVESSDISFDL